MPGGRSSFTFRYGVPQAAGRFDAARPVGKPVQTPFPKKSEDTMTITLSKTTAVILIALVGMLAGLALGQLTQADSAQPKASASAGYGPIVAALNKLNGLIGSTKNDFSLVGRLEALDSSIYAICYNIGPSGSHGDCTP
jgi:hypothetical protein